MREKKLSLDEMSGGGITISNLGGIGGTYFTPIVNWPEVAILGVSRGTTEPIWRPRQAQGVPSLPRERRTLGTAPDVPLSLSYDHRVIDGADAMRFLRWVVEAIEQPFLLIFTHEINPNSKEPNSHSWGCCFWKLVVGAPSLARGGWGRGSERTQWRVNRRKGTWRARWIRRRLFTRLTWACRWLSSTRKRTPEACASLPRVHTVQGAAACCESHRRGEACRHWGVTFGEPAIDVNKLRSYKQGVVDKLTAGVGSVGEASQGGRSCRDARR